MRIAHVITRMIIGGAQENTLFNCLDLIRDHGDQVLLITGPSLGPEGSLLEQGRGAELPVALIDSLRRSLNPYRDFTAYQEILKTLRAFKPDVVHTHSAKGGMLGREAAWKLGVPCIIHTVHGAPFHPYQNLVTRQIYRACERHAAGRCHHFISVADAMTELMVQGGIATPDRFTTIYSGMEVEPLRHAKQSRQAMRQQLGIRAEEIVFIKIARLFHLKGHNDLITAAIRIIQENPLVRFLWVGDGLLRESLEQRIHSLGLERHFILAGLVTPDEIPKYLGAADALVHTSYREGLARALPQALIAGIPVVSYDVDGAREVVFTGITGELVPAGNTRSLADSILKLASDRSARERQGREGERRFSDVFCHHQMTRSIRELYLKKISPAV